MTDPLFLKIHFSITTILLKFLIWWLWKKDMTYRNGEINSVNLYLQQVLIILVVQIDWIKGTTYTAINTANTMISYGNMDVECMYIQSYTFVWNVWFYPHISGGSYQTYGMWLQNNRFNNIRNDLSNVNLALKLINF